ncbi:MAG TPA: hypothetical protein VMN58_09485 [Acidimicrobiales bacterium]|nr:hypothetical protein [Acidimicrobiales bacterium]
MPVRRLTFWLTGPYRRRFERLWASGQQLVDAEVLRFFQPAESGT